MSADEPFYSGTRYKNQEQLFKNEDGFIIGETDGRLMRLNKDGAPLFTFSSDRDCRENYTIIPNLLTHPGSVLSLSVGPRVVEETLAFRRDVLGQEIFVFDPYGVTTDLTDQPSSSINLFDTLYPDLACFEADVYVMVESLLQPFKASAPLEQARYNRLHPTVLDCELSLRPQMASQLLTAMFIYLKTADESEVPLKNRNLAYCAEMLGSDKEAWNDLMLRMQNYDKKWRVAVNLAGRDFSICDKNMFSMFSMGTKEMASMALSFARGPAFADKIKESSMDFHDLRNKKMSVYVVMPEGYDVELTAPWLRLMVGRAQSLLPNVINSDDRHCELRQQDRILFILDDFHKLGSLCTFRDGLSSTPFYKGITYWGLAPNKRLLLNAYDGYFIASSNNACVQELDRTHASDNHGRDMLELVKQQIMALRGILWVILGKIKALAATSSGF